MTNLETTSSALSSTEQAMANSPSMSQIKSHTAQDDSHQQQQQTAVATAAGSIAQSENGHGSPDNDKTMTRQDNQKAGEETKRNLTPEQQKRLTALQTKRDSLHSTLTKLQRTQTLLLHQLNLALPTHLTRFLDTPDDYLPSTYAHTIPSLPHVDADDKEALLREANAITKQHIQQLHEYNEIKDVAQGLIGMIAEKRGVRVVHCEADFGVGPGD